MIKLSKIKIAKRAMLSMLAIIFLLCGAYMAAKMVHIFQVNAAETDGQPTTANSNNVEKVTIESNIPWTLYYKANNNGEGTGETVLNLSTPQIAVTEYDGVPVDYAAYCIDPATNAPEGNYDRTELEDEPESSTDVTNRAIKLAIYMASVDRDGSNNKFSTDEKDKVAAKMSEWFNTNTINSKWNAEITDSPYPNSHGIYPHPYNCSDETTCTLDEEGMRDFKYLFMHLIIGYIYNHLDDPSHASREELVNLYNNYTNDYDLSIIENVASSLKDLVRNKDDLWLIAKNYVLYNIDPESNPEDVNQIQHVVWIEDGNPEYGNIKVEKCDSKTELCGADGEAGQFEGVTFTVANNSTSKIYAPEIQNTNLGGPNAGTHFFDPGEVLATGTTESDGTYTFEKLPLNVEYLVTEVSSNDSYIATARPQTTTITTNGATNTLKFYNDGVWLGTTAKDDKDGDKFLQADGESVIVDTVEYCVTPDQTYTITGVLMDKSTGKPLLIDGNQVTGGPVTIKPTGDGCGTIDMSFKFDSSALGGKELVVFETLSLDKEVIVSHEEIDDPAQTIFVVSLGTTATDASDGDKTIIAGKGAVIIDKIEYCLKAGTEYTFTGILMDKATGESIKIEGQPVTETLTITPEKNCGTVDMEFKFDATGLGGTEVVVFESVGTIDSATDKYTLIASHEDLEDAGQTIKIIKKKAPETGIFTNKTSISSNSDDNNAPIIIAIAAVSCVIVVYIGTRLTAKRRFMGRR